MVVTVRQAIQCGCLKVAIQMSDSEIEVLLFGKNFGNDLKTFSWDVMGTPTTHGYNVSDLVKPSCRLQQYHSKQLQEPSSGAISVEISEDWSLR